MYVQTNSGERIELDQTFDSGGEAQIWSVRRKPNVVAKLYHKPTSQREAKLLAMLANPPSQSTEHPAIAWPTHLLYNRRQFVGFLMTRVPDSRPIFHYYNPARRAKLTPPFPWPYFLHRVARNLAAAVELVHARDHLIGDLNESNVLVNHQALVTLVDTDSFQVRATLPNGQSLLQWLGQQPTEQTYRSMVGKPEFTPPELQGIDFKSTDRLPTHDHFSMGVLLFYLLMNGFHPFAGVMIGGESVGRVDLYCMRRGLFPYSGSGPVQPPPAASKFEWLHPEIQAAFRRCFVEGHKQVDQRPTAREWRQLLSNAEATLTLCNNDRTHVYSSHLSHCPYCPAQVQPRPAPKPARPAPPHRAKSAARLRNQKTILLEQFMQLLRLKLRTAFVSLPSRQMVVANAQTLLVNTQAEARRWINAVGRWRQTAMTQIPPWRDWVVAHVVGTALGGLLAVALVFAGVSLNLGIGLPLASWLVLGATLVGLVAGAPQWYILRQQLGAQRPEQRLWLASSGVAGAVTGVVAQPLLTAPWFAQAELLVNFQWVLLGALFGLLSGWMQALILRRHLRQAADARPWTLVNAIGWSLVVQGWLIGQEWDFVGTTGRAVDGMIGLLAGLLLCGLLTGATLVWLWREPRQVLPQPLPRWSFALIATWPAQLQTGARRWLRAGLLLMAILLLLQIILRLSGLTAGTVSPLLSLFL